MVFQFSDRLQRRAFRTSGIEIETQRFRELKLRDAVLVLGGDQNRVLVRERDLRLQNVEARNRARLKSVLLILQLALQEFDGLLLHADERAIEKNLIELLLGRRDRLVDNIAKSVVARVPGEIGRPNLRNDPAAGENHLGRFNAHIVRALDAAEVKARTSDWRSGSTRAGRRRHYGRGLRSAMIFLQMRIRV